MLTDNDITTSKSQWIKHSDAIRQVIEEIAPVDVECSARLLYRASRPAMRQLGLYTPAELYDALQYIYAESSDEVYFSDQLAIGFGKTNRTQQIRSFVENHANEPKSMIANNYEREYGFSAGVAEIWIDQFSEPEEISFSDWLNGASHNDASKRDIDQAKRENDKSTVIDFLARELNGDICDANLIRRRFAYEFPGESNVINDADILDEFGYYVDRGLVFKSGKTPRGHFLDLISKSPFFKKGDPGFESAVWKHPTFRNVLQRLLTKRHVLIYERDGYILFSRLHELTGIELTDIDSYASTTLAAVDEYKPFTICSLHESETIQHPLDSLGMPDAFYEGLLDSSGFFRSCQLGGVKVFCSGEGKRLTATSIMEWLVANHEGIERDSIRPMVLNELGIDCPQPTLITTLYNSAVYYDDIGEAYYSSIEQWKKEVRNELAR